ncbi:hypothetical protein LDENG_00255990 [Lucifuga dentata]|nr:hypothetical protein LDENG_00255990 [Lucifuga dentata]
MSWMHGTLFALLAVLLVLSCEQNPFFICLLLAQPSPAYIVGPLRKIFMKEADASNFFRRRSRRGAKSQDEINGEAVKLTLFLD